MWRPPVRSDEDANNTSIAFAMLLVVEQDATDSGCHGCRMLTVRSKDQPGPDERRRGDGGRAAEERVRPRVVRKRETDRETGREGGREGEIERGGERYRERGVSLKLRSTGNSVSRKVLELADQTLGGWQRTEVALWAMCGGWSAEAWSGGCSAQRITRGRQAVGGGDSTVEARMVTGICLLQTSRRQGGEKERESWGSLGFG